MKEVSGSLQWLWHSVMQVRVLPYLLRVNIHFLYSKSFPLFQFCASLSAVTSCSSDVCFWHHLSASRSLWEKTLRGRTLGGYQQRELLFYTSREWRQLCPELGVKRNDRLLYCWTILFLSFLTGAGAKELLQLLCEAVGCFWRC